MGPVRRACDGFGDGLVEVIGQAGHVGQGVDVAGADAAAVGADSAPEERGVLVVLGRPGYAVWVSTIG